MVTALYAAIFAFWLCYLTLQVVKQRKAYQVGYGDGGINDLQVARSAHSNAIDTIPISLILLALLEINSGQLWMIHVLGIALLFGRVLHGRAILAQQLKNRILGMQITLMVIILAALGNLVYLPWASLI